MKNRSSVVLRRLIFATILCCVPGTSFGQMPHRQGVQTAQATPKRQGFLDYALGKINPHDKNYGASIESGRAAIVEHTINDLYFWSNVLSLVLLSWLFVIVLFQWRAMDKRELIAASLIAQLWNGRVSDRIEIERRTEQFNRLVEAHNAEVERALSAKTQSPENGHRTDSELKQTVEGLDKRQVKAGATVRDGAVTRASNVAANTRDEQATAAGLQQRKAILERQVEAMRNTEANLRRRLNDTMAELEQERNRNQTLKGA